MLLVVLLEDVLHCREFALQFGVALLESLDLTRLLLELRERQFHIKSDHQHFSQNGGLHTHTILLPIQSYAYTFALENLDAVLLLLHRTLVLRVLALQLLELAAHLLDLYIQYTT